MAIERNSWRVRLFSSRLGIASQRLLDLRTAIRNISPQRLRNMRSSDSHVKLREFGPQCHLHGDRTPLLCLCIRAGSPWAAIARVETHAAQPLPWRPPPVPPWTDGLAGRKDHVYDLAAGGAWYGRNAAGPSIAFVAKTTLSAAGIVTLARTDRHRSLL